MKRKYKNNSSKDLNRFINAIVKLDPVEFVGLTRLLCTSMVDENFNPRPFEDILSDIMDKFVSISNSKRKEILSIIESAGKEN